MIERKYITLLSTSLKSFEKKGESLWNFRCPYCECSVDSNPKKKRGYIFEKSGVYFYYCHKCSDKAKRFDYFLKDQNPYLYRELKLENIGKPKSKYIPPVKIKRVANKPKFNIIEKSKLPAHVIKYLNSRKLPLDKFQYTNKFYEYINDIKSGSFNMKKVGKYDHQRLIIPINDSNGNLIAIQGRSLGGELPKYMNIGLEGDKGVYGLELLDMNKPIFVLEGIPDALMIDNAVAILDSNYIRAISIFPDSELIIIPDTDVRNKQIMKNVLGCIKSGTSVCLLPADTNGKDLNEMAINGMSKPELIAIISKYTFKGIKAKLEFNKWRKDR